MESGAGAHRAWKPPIGRRYSGGDRAAQPGSARRRAVPAAARAIRPEKRWPLVKAVVAKAFKAKAFMAKASWPRLHGKPRPAGAG